VHVEILELTVDALKILKKTFDSTVMPVVLLWLKLKFRRP